VTFDVLTDICHSSIPLFLVQVDNSRCQISREFSISGYMPRIISAYRTHTRSLMVDCNWIASSSIL